MSEDREVENLISSYIETILLTSIGDYDGWESLGNKGWGWKGLAPYFRKHQTLDKTECKSSNPKFMPAAGGDEYHGSNGPIHTSCGFSLSSKISWVCVERFKA